MRVAKRNVLVIVLGLFAAAMSLAAIVFARGGNCRSTDPCKWRGKTVIGYLETVRVFPGNLLFHAKVDSGADHSSINATNIIDFKKGNETWIRFTVIDDEGKKVTLERKFVRFYKVKVKDAEGGWVARPVVMMQICLGGQLMWDTVNIADRAGFSRQMLVGRSYMRDKFLIHPSSKHLTEPKCKEPAIK